MTTIVPTRTPLPPASARSPESPRPPESPRSPVGFAAVLDALETTLPETTFAVIDLETTGLSPATCGVTEVGVVKFRGGECVATLHTLVNPRRPIPRVVRRLTGITPAMVSGAPRIGAVLPSLLEFLRGSVIVGHNVAFDVGFLNAALNAHGYDRLDHPRLDTVAISRRLVRAEVDNLKLATLLRHFQIPTKRTHRALDDARATAALLHLLLARAGYETSAARGGVGV